MFMPVFAQSIFKLLVLLVHQSQISHLYLQCLLRGRSTRGETTTFGRSICKHEAATVKETFRHRLTEFFTFRLKTLHIF